MLVVEDNPGDARLIMAFARTRDVEVEHVSTVRGACERLQAGAPVDVVLLDLRLPDAVGLEACAAVLPAAGAAPVVALTGIDDDDLARRCLDLGMQDYIRKIDLSEVVLFRAVDHAISRKRAMELQRRVEVAERHAALGRLAGAIAHEINNQLTPLMFNAADAQRCAAELDGAAGSNHEALEQLGECLETELVGLDRVAGLVREMQRFVGGARTDGSGAHANLNDVVQRAVRLMRNTLEQVATLELQLNPCDPIAADPEKVEQVVINLLTNAAEALDGSTDDATIRVTTGRRGDYSEIKVEDNGVGIPAAHQARLFEPFFTSKSRERSTGLGLAICAEILARFGGDIEVQSVQGSGSSFTVVLPVARDVVRLVTPDPDAQSSDRGRASGLDQTPAAPRRRLLLVDDSTAVRRAIASLLEQHHDVIEAGGGREALEVLARDRSFDVLVCDLMMPGIDGVGLCKAVQAMDVSLASRIVILSGGAFNERARRFLEAHAYPVLSKPCTPHELLQVIEEISSTRH